VGSSVANFHVSVSSNKQRTLLFAKIKNEKQEVIKEIIELVSSLGIKLHQKFLNKQCVEWIKNDYQEPVGNIVTTAEVVSGGSTFAESISGSPII
jgi:hypothetical protein